VPRKNPLSKRELSICTRLKEFRADIRYPRRLFANHAGLDSSTIVRIELGRAPLRYDAARRICDIFSVNPAWLAKGGQAPRRLWRKMPAAQELGIGPDATFSEAYDKHLAAIFCDNDEKALLGLPQNPKTLDEHIRSLGESIAIMFLGSQRSVDQQSAALVEILNNPLPIQQVTIEAARVVAENLHQNVLQKSGKSPLPPSTTKLSSILEPGKILYAHYESIVKKAEESGLLAKRYLTNAESADSSIDVEAQLPELLERLKKATSAPGKKTELAGVLKAPLASVSRWLSGEREPGGEIALQMDAWAIKQGFPRKRPSNQK
jgi:transcriptional regulator with XRE-family HTH domain